MIFELLHAPMPDGYGEALLPLDLCKLHLGVTQDDHDELIEALRDAAIDFIEQFCAVKLLSTPEQAWRGECFPDRGRPLRLGMQKVTAITAIRWAGRSGLPVIGDVADFRVAMGRELLPAIGKRWPADVGGDVQVTFTAGYPEDAAPQSLLAAARLFMGHLWQNREAVIDGMTAEVPFGVRSMCAPFRRVEV